MVKLLICNKKEKFLYIRYFKNGVPALNYLDKLYHVPPQSRVVQLVMYVVKYEPTSVEHRIEYYYNIEPLTKSQLDLYHTYPLYLYHKKEVKRYGRP